MTGPLFHSLGYLAVATPAVAAWPRFATEVLGAEVEQGDGQRLLVRWDDRAYRLAIHPGPEDRLLHLGWEVADPGEFRRVVDELRDRGQDVQVEPNELAVTRKVRHLASFPDPLGIRHEVFAGPLAFDRSFEGARPTTRFVTGPQGLGHAVLVVPELTSAVAFYEDVIGLRCSDVVTHGGDLGRMSFLRCNTRHHSIALWEMPGDRLGLQHIMIESADMNEVGRSYDIVHEGPWEISATLGRHVGDEQLSFYVRSPSGFDVELGCESIDVDDTTWTMRHIDKTAGSPNEVWGHHFQPLGPQSSIHPVDHRTGG